MSSMGMRSHIVRGEKKSSDVRFVSSLVLRHLIDANSSNVDRLLLVLRVAEVDLLEGELQVVSEVGVGCVANLGHPSLHGLHIHRIGRHLTTTHVGHRHNLFEGVVGSQDDELSVADCAGTLDLSKERKLVQKILEQLVHAVAPIVATDVLNNEDLHQRRHTFEPLGHVLLNADLIFDISTVLRQLQGCCSLASPWLAKEVEDVFLHAHALGELHTEEPLDVFFHFFELVNGDVFKKGLLILVLDGIDGVDVFLEQRVLRALLGGWSTIGDKKANAFWCVHWGFAEIASC